MSKEVSYKELCAEVYSITRVTHKDGPVDKNPRGYSPDWWLQGKLDRRAENMFYAKQGGPDFKADDKGTIACFHMPKGAH